jgi:L-tyrosine peroxygenase
VSAGGRAPAYARQFPVPRLLFMPPTGHEFAEQPRETDDIELTDLAFPDYDVFGVRKVEARPLFWYRWIAGHQISFVLWRAMCDIVRHHDDMPTERELDMLTACVDGYSAMLLYSSTVPREHYHAHTRVRMALQHPSFSGAWAPDYRPIRRLFRSRLPWQGDPACAALAEAVARNRMTHDHIADHLVPDGRSLLQKAAGGSAPSVSQEKEDLYDNFFMTIRRPVSHAELISQLTSRIAELVADLVRNGLYPNVGGRHHPVVTAWSDDVMRPLVNGISRTLRRAAQLMKDMRLQDVRS